MSAPTKNAAVAITMSMKVMLTKRRLANIGNNDSGT